MINRIAIAAAALAISGSTFGAQAAQTSVMQFRGLEGDASWSTQSADFCTLTFLSVSGVQQVQHQAGGDRTVQDQVLVQLTTFNQCNGQGSSRFGFAPGNVSGNLQRVTVQGSIPLVDYSTATSITATVNVSFDRTNDFTQTGNNVTSNSTPFFTFRSRANGTNVSASATGSVVVDGVDLTGGAAASNASILDVNNGNISIIRN